MLHLALYSLYSLILRLVLLALRILSYKSINNKEITSPFERGFDIAHRVRLPFCIKFFLLAVVFLIFDVEISLMILIPYRQTFIILFLLILFIGLIYEWYYGGLDWLVYVNGSIVRHDRCTLKRNMTYSMNINRSQFDIFSPSNTFEMKLQES